MGRSGMGWRTLGEVQDVFGEPLGVLRRVIGPSGKFGSVRGPLGRSGRGRWNLTKVRDGSGDPRGGLRRVRGHSGRTGTGRGTLPEFLDGPGDPRVV